MNKAKQKLLGGLKLLGNKPHKEPVIPNDYADGIATRFIKAMANAMKSPNLHTNIIYSQCKDDLQRAVMSYPSLAAWVHGRWTRLALYSVNFNVQLTLNEHESFGEFAGIKIEHSSNYRSIYLAMSDDKPVGSGNVLYSLSSTENTQEIIAIKDKFYKAIVTTESKEFLHDDVFLTRYEPITKEAYNEHVGKLTEELDRSYKAALV